MTCVKETYGADVGCTEDGRNGRIGATRYAGGNGTRKEAEKRNVYRRGERLGLSLCAVPSPCGMWGLLIYRRDRGLRSNEGIRSRVVMQARRRIRTEYLRQVEGQVTGGLHQENSMLLKLT